MKAAFRHILLAALLLRALVPFGWMPGTTQLGQAAFIICGADGGLRHGLPGKDDAARAQQPCAFAAAAQLFDMPDATVLAPPSSIALTAAGTAAPTSRFAAAAYAPQAPRAPPSLT